MTVWQVVSTVDTDNIIFQANSARELADRLNISVGAVFMFHHRQKTMQNCGRNKKYRIEKIILQEE